MTATGYVLLEDGTRFDGEVCGAAGYALGEVVFFEPPAVGTSVSKDAAYAEVESVKAVSDVISPLSGEIIDVNAALAENPQAINEDPYGEGWLVKVRLADPAEREALMDAASYASSLAG